MVRSYTRGWTGARPGWGPIGFVFTVRCTRKFLARLHSTTKVDDVEPTTVLGDWYGNLIYRRGGQVVRS